MFNNIKGAEESVLDNSTEKDNSAASPAEETQKDDTLTGSEADKNTEGESNDDGKPFHEHSRFKELINEKNKLKEDLAAKSTQLDSVQNKLAEMNATIQKLDKKNDVPEFETLEDLSAYLKELPNKLKAEIISDFEKKQEKETVEKQKTEDAVQSELDKISAEDKKFGREEQRDFLKWVVEEELTELPLAKAYKFYQKTTTTKNNNDIIDKRKSQSGIAKSVISSGKVEFEYNPRQSMDDIIREAKSNLKT